MQFAVSSSDWGPIRTGEELASRPGEALIIAVEHVATRELLRNGLRPVVSARNCEPSFVRTVLDELNSMGDIVPCVLSGLKRLIDWYQPIGDWR